MTTRWSEEKTAQLDRLYRDHENLWNITVPRNRDRKSASMQTIAEELNIPKTEVPKKIKSLWSTYHLEFSKVDKSKASGGGTSFIYKPSVLWYVDMSHIMKTTTVKEKETHSNLEIGIQENGLNIGFQPDDDINDILNEPNLYAESAPKVNKTTSRIKPKCKKRRFEAITDAVQQLTNLNDSMNTSTTAILEDECVIMGKHIAIQLRELPIYDRARANFEIQKILMDYRLNNMKNASSSTTSLSSAASTIQSSYG